MSNIEVKDATLYAAVIPPSRLEVKDVALYMAVIPTPQVGVRQSAMTLMRPDTRPFTSRISSLSLMRRAFAHDFSKPVTDLLYAAISKGMGIAFDATKGTWGNPRANVAGDYMNSLIDCTAAAGSKLTGVMTFRYNRYNINAAFVGKDPTAFPVPEATTIHAVLPQVNSFYNLALTTADVRNGGVAANGLVVLQAVSTSMRFLPNSLIRLGTTVKDLNGSIAVGDLTGFTAA